MAWRDYMAYTPVKLTTVGNTGSERKQARVGRALAQTPDEIVLCLVMPQPSLFIGSSEEGIEFARAVRSSLARDAEVTLWKDGFFRPGITYIDSLINSLPRFDFAVLVLRPEDLVISRDIESFGPRDNVIFELGLFMGRLGKERTIMVHQESTPMKLPSDLAGVATATYKWPRGDNDYLNAVGGASDEIRKVIRDLGFSPAKVSKELGMIRSHQQQQDLQISSHTAEIRALKFSLQGILTQYEYDKIVGLDGNFPFLCYYSEDLYNELKRLRAMQLIGNHDGVGLGTIRRDYKDRNQQFDLKRFFFITDLGRDYLRLRKELARQNDDAD
jgi:predicted nucleotide-binding protein